MAWVFIYHSLPRKLLNLVFYLYVLLLDNIFVTLPNYDQIKNIASLPPTSYLIDKMFPLSLFALDL